MHDEYHKSARTFTASPRVRVIDYRSALTNYQPPMCGVATIARRQSVVCITLRDALIFQQMDAICLAHSRQSVRNDDGRAALARHIQRALSGGFGLVSTALVASSTTRIGGFLKTARAKAKR